MAQENEIVLIYYEEQPISFARIESISPDVKKDWYHVKLLLLQIPLQTVTWILRDVYIDGEEFTMGGKRMRLEKIEAPPEEQAETEKDKEEEAGRQRQKQKEEGTESEESQGGAKVVSLRERQNKT